MYTKMRRHGSNVVQCTFSQLEIVVARKVLVRKVAAATYRKSLLKLQLLKRILNPFIPLMQE